MNDRYIIICLDDDGEYRLLRRETFPSKETANNLLSGIALSRKPMIVACSDDTVILRKETL